jgi:hypothetical protein
MHDDDVLISLLEQAEILTRAWTASLSDFPAQRETSCPPPEMLQAYVAGALELEQAAHVLAHLGECQSCRKEVRKWHLLRNAELGGGTCTLSALRGLIRQEPELAARALVRVSRRIASLILPQPAGPGVPIRLDLGVLDAQGQPAGEWLSVVVERPPYLDAQYRLCLDVHALEAAHVGYRLCLTLQDALGKIALGTVTLAEGMTQVAVDLRDLYVQPGYVPLETLDITAARVPLEVERSQAVLVQTGPQVLPGTALSSRSTVGQTLTAEQLVGLPPPGREQPGAIPKPPDTQEEP